MPHHLLESDAKVLVLCGHQEVEDAINQAQALCVRVRKVGHEFVVLNGPWLARVLDVFDAVEIRIEPGPVAHEAPRRHARSAHVVDNFEHRVQRLVNVGNVRA